VTKRADAAAELVSDYPLPDLDSLPEDIRQRIQSVHEKSGFIPNVFLVFAHRPEEFRAFFAYHDALMLKDSALSKAEREMIVVATSAANACSYCVIAHGAILRIHSKSPSLADLVAVNYRGAPISERQRAMLDFAVKLARTPDQVTATDRAALTAVGFDAEAIWDIGAITALFALSNRMAHLTGMHPNAEFFALGRNPRSTQPSDER
jgi:uncharacterized peroxidase-related enzyme